MSTSASGSTNVDNKNSKSRIKSCGVWIKRKNQNGCMRSAKKSKKWSMEREQAHREETAAKNIQYAWSLFLPRLRAARTIQGAWQRKVFREFATLQQTMPNVECAFCGEYMRDPRDMCIQLYSSSPSSKHHLTCVGTRNSPACFTCMLKWLRRDSRCPHCRENIGVISYVDDVYPEYIYGGKRLKLRYRVGTFIDRRTPMPSTDGDEEMAMHLAGISDTDDSSSDEDSPFNEDSPFDNEPEPNHVVNLWSEEWSEEENEQADVVELAQVRGQPIQVPVVAQMTREERVRQLDESVRVIVSSDQYEGATPEEEVSNRSLASLVRERSALPAPRLPRRHFRPEYLALPLQLYRSNQPTDRDVFYHRGDQERVLPGDVVSFFGVMPAGPQVVECAQRNLRGVVVRVGYDPTVFILPHYGWFVVPLIDLNFEERAEGDVWEQFRPIGHAHPPISEITFRNSVLSVALQWLAQHTRLCESRVQHERRLRDQKYYWNDLAHVLRSYEEFEQHSRDANMHVISADVLFTVRNLQDNCSEYETRHAITLLNTFDAQWLILDNCRLAIATLFFKSEHFRTLLLNTVVLYGGYHCSRTHERFALIAIATIYRMFVHNRIQFSTPFQETCARHLLETPDSSYDELTLKQWMCVVHSIMEERQLETCLRRLSGWRAHAPLLRICDYDLARNFLTIDSGPMLERLRLMDASGQAEFATVREWVRAGYFV